MAHFAKIDENNIVKQVITISNCAIGGCIGPTHWDYQEEYHQGHGNLDFPDTEPLGQKVIADSGFEGTWLQTSYNNNFRGKFAGTEMIYDPVADEFKSQIFEEE